MKRRWFLGLAKTFDYRQLGDGEANGRLGLQRRAGGQSRFSGGSLACIHLRDRSLFLSFQLLQKFLRGLFSAVDTVGDTDPVIAISRQGKSRIFA